METTWFDADVSFQMDLLLKITMHSMTTDPLPVNIDTHRTETLNRNLRHKVTDTQVSCDLLSSGRYWFRQLFSSPILSVVQLKIFASFNLFTPIGSQWSALQLNFWLRGDPDESWSANRLKPRECAITWLDRDAYFEKKVDHRPVTSDTNRVTV